MKFLKFLVLLLITSQSFGQYYTQNKAWQIFDNAGFKNLFIANDTTTVPDVSKNYIAIKNAIIYYWNGSKWAAITGTGTGGTSYVLPQATPTTLGGIKYNTDFYIDANGRLGIDTLKKAFWNTVANLPLFYAKGDSVWRAIHDTAVNHDLAFTNKFTRTGNTIDLIELPFTEKDSIALSLPSADLTIDDVAAIRGINDTSIHPQTVDVRNWIANIKRDTINLAKNQFYRGTTKDSIVYLNIRSINGNKLYGDTGNIVIAGGGATIDTTNLHRQDSINAVAIATKTDSVTINTGPVVDTLVNYYGNLAVPTGTISKHEDGLVSGGVVTSGSGLSVDVTGATYYINGKLYTSPAGSLALNAADPALDRQDVIAVNTSGQIVKKTGTAAVNPIEPQTDPATELPLTSVYISAGATSINGISTNVIYNENAVGEWSPTATGITSDASNTVAPFSGTKAWSLGAWSSGDLATLTNGTTFDKTTLTTFKFYLRLKATVASTASINIKFFNGTTAVSNELSIVNYGLNKSTVGSYMNISMPISAFSFTSNTFNKVQIRFGGTNASGVYIDYVQFQNGIATTTNANFVSSNFARNDSLFYIANNKQIFFYKAKDTSSLSTRINQKLNITDTANMRLRAIAGTNMTITGTYPNLTFNSTAIGGGTDNTAYHTVTTLSDSTGFTLNRPNGTKDTIQIAIPASIDTTGKFVNNITKNATKDSFYVWKGSTYTALKDSTGGGSGGGTPANPTATVSLTAANGSATTYMRSDAAPALSQSIAPTWTGLHNFSPTITSTGGTAHTTPALSITPTLTAAVAGDTIAALEIKPTFVGTASFNLYGLKLYSSNALINGLYLGSRGNDATNTAFGLSAMKAVTGTTSNAGNTGIGNGALQALTTGTSNTAIGYGGPLGVITTGSNNTGVGGSVLYNAPASSGNNTAVGTLALGQTTGSNGVAIGMNAGRASTGNGVHIGYQAGTSDASGNKFWLANAASGALLYGDFSTGQVATNADPRRTTQTFTSAASFEVSKSNNRGSIPAPVMSSAERDLIAVQSGVVTRILVSGGSGYTSSPTVTVGGAGTGATATSSFSAGYFNITVTNGGTGYDPSTTTVTLSGGGGSGATAYAIVGAQGVSVYCVDCTATDGSRGVLQYYNGAWKNAW